MSHCVALPLAFFRPSGRSAWFPDCLPPCHQGLPVPAAPPPALALVTQFWWLLSLLCQQPRRLCQSETGAISNSILSATDAAWAGPQKNKLQLCGFFGSPASTFVLTRGGRENLSPAVICILKHLNTDCPPAWHFVFL